MKRYPWPRQLTIYLELGFIMAGLLFLGYQRFLDGAAVRPVDVYKMFPPSADPTTDSFTSSYSVGVLGDVIGAYSVKTDKTSYKIGEDIYLTLNFCHNRPITPIVQFTFVDSVITALPARQGDTQPLGCYTDSKVIAAKVPPQLALTPSDTKYQLRGVISYRANPLRKVSYLLVSNIFNINH